MLFADLHKNIELFLIGLKNTLERQLNHGGALVNDRERFLRLVLIIEAARIRFNTFTKYKREVSSDEWFVIRSDLILFVDSFSNSKDAGIDLLSRRFRFGGALVHQKDNITLMFQPILDNPGVSITAALHIFRTYIQQTSDTSASIKENSSFSDLRWIVPIQQVTPVHFDVVQNRVVVVPRTPLTQEPDRENILSALEHIKSSGSHLIKNLENSNCDLRLVESVKELQAQIATDGNVVRIGLANMACGAMSAQFQSELPDAVIAMFYSYSTSISSYVAQFPEWERFTQKAAAIDMTEEDLFKLNKTAVNLTEELTNNPKLADPEVPKTILFVQQFLSAPGASSKRAAFAMICTVENLVSAIVRYSLDFFSKTTEKIVEHGSSVASKFIIALLGIAFIGASGIGSAANRAGVPWVKQAADIILKQIESTIR